MKVSLALLIFLTPVVFGQNQADNPAPGGCGQPSVHFVVQTGKRNHPTPVPGSGKAIVYFIQDDTHFLANPRPTTRIGIDGNWIGATRATSYLFQVVEPGEHHLCASWQSSHGFNVENTAAAAHLTAEAGHAYYFLIENSYRFEPRIPAEVRLTRVDSDEGELLASKSLLSSSHPR